jgi:polyferredoxin
MDRVGLPRGLVKFDSERNQKKQAAGEKPDHWTHRLVRPRTITYAGILALVAAVMLTSLATRGSLDVNVLHDRNPLYVTLSDGDIRNGFTIKILNKSREARAYELSLAGLPEATMTVVGQEDGDGPPVLEAGQDTVASYRVFVTAPLAALDGDAIPVDFVLTELETGESDRHASVFRGP